MTVSENKEPPLRNPRFWRVESLSLFVVSRFRSRLRHQRLVSWANEAMEENRIQQKVRKTRCRFFIKRILPTKVYKNGDKPVANQGGKLWESPGHKSSSRATRCTKYSSQCYASTKFFNETPMISFQPAVKLAMPNL